MTRFLTGLSHGDILGAIANQKYMDKETKEEFENLARMVQNGFLELGGKIDKLEVRTGSLEGRMESMEGRMESMEGRMESMEGHVESIEGKVDILDMKVSRVDRRTENQADSLYEDMHELKDRVAVVEKKNGIAPPKPKFAAA
jgi:chromosome segregation ATPase